MARETLKQARKDKGMTQQAVAEAVGVSLVYYKQIESAKRNGSFSLWDSLEVLLETHQRELREIQGKHHDQAGSQ